MADDLETQIRERFDADDFDGAATLALEGYGSEIVGYLMATMRSETDASEVFSQLCEDMWKGLPRFGWRCLFRSWLYKLGRHAAARFRRSPANQRRRHANLSKVEELADRVRSRTMTHLRTAVKDQYALLRDALDPDAQTLLILRVNREMSWLEIARVMSDEEDPNDEELNRVAGRMRKRFQTVKDRLRAQAEKMGLLEGTVA